MFVALLITNETCFVYLINYISPDGELTDISEERYDDLNTIASVLKLYFRLLPIPLVTFDVYFKVIDIVRKSLYRRFVAREKRIIRLLDLFPVTPFSWHRALCFVTFLSLVVCKKWRMILQAGRTSLARRSWNSSSTASNSSHLLTITPSSTWFPTCTGEFWVLRVQMAYWNEPILFNVTFVNNIVSNSL